MALAFLVSCLISAASFHDRTWRVFMTNSALNFSDMLSFLLPLCPLALGLQASAPCPPSVPQGPSATRTASLCVPKESIPKCLNTASFTQVVYLWRAPIPVIEQWAMDAAAHLSCKVGLGTRHSTTILPNSSCKPLPAALGHQVQHLVLPSLFNSKRCWDAQGKSTLPVFPKSSPLKWQKSFQWWVRPRREN